MNKKFYIVAIIAALVTSFYSNGIFIGYVISTAFLVKYHECDISTVNLYKFICGAMIILYILFTFNTVPNPYYAIHSVINICTIVIMTHFNIKWIKQHNEDNS